MRTNYDLFSGYVPPILRDSELKVYEYKIVDLPKSFVLSHNLRELLENERKSLCDYAKYTYWYDLANLTSPPSKLISYSNTLTRTYNPFEDGKLFKKFANLGKRDTVNEKGIKNFVDKYGLLTHIKVEDDRIDQEYPMVSVKEDKNKNPISINEILERLKFLRVTISQDNLINNTDKPKPLEDAIQMLKDKYGVVIPKTKEDASPKTLEDAIQMLKNKYKDKYEVVIPKKDNKIDYYDLLVKNLGMRDTRVKQEYPGYPIKAFHKHAREAYIILELYESLMKRESNRIRELLISYVNFQDFPVIFERLVANTSIFTQRVDHPFFFKFLLPKFIANNVYVPDEYEYISASPTGEDDYLNSAAMGDEDVLYWWTGDQEYTTEFWIECFEHAPKDFLYKCASDLIAAITNEHIQLSPGLSIRPQSLSPNYTFHNVWRSSSLLNALWIQFYLEITHQFESEKKINCSICGRVIENPRGKQRFCNNEKGRKCRQTHYLRLKRNVIRLRKEGRTVEEIADLMLDEELSKERIERWVNALSKDQS